MSEELRKCPFCEKSFRAIALKSDRVAISHDSPGCPLNEQDKQVISLSYDELAGMMNARPIEDALRAELAATQERNRELEAEVERLKGELKQAREELKEQRSLYRELYNERLEQDGLA